MGHLRDSFHCGGAVRDIIGLYTKFAYLSFVVSYLFCFV